jgi:hypothetical protein
VEVVELNPLLHRVDDELPYREVEHVSPAEALDANKVKEASPRPAASATAITFLMGQE